MAPERSPKRVKPNPSVEQPIKRVAAAHIGQTPATSLPTKEPQPPSENLGKQEQPSQSWYSRTWPRKAVPVTQVAKESITSASNAASGVVADVAQRATRRAQPTRSGSLRVALGKSTPERAPPVAATTTPVHAMPESSKPRRRMSSKSLSPNKHRKAGSAANTAAVSQANGNVAKRAEDKKNTQILNAASNTPLPESQFDHKRDTSSGVNSVWLSWFTKPELEDRSELSPKNDVNDEPEAFGEPEPTPEDKEPEEAVNTAQAHEATEAQASVSKRGWLQIWGNETSSRPNSAPPEGRTPVPAGPGKETATMKSLLVPETNVSQSAPVSKAPSIETSAPPALPGDSSKSAGWVFWSRDRKDNSSAMSEEQPLVGEIAISDTPSQRLPRRASIKLTDTRPNPIVDARARREAVRQTQSPASSIKDGRTAQNKTLKDKAVANGPKPVESKAPMETSKGESSKVSASSKAPEEVKPQDTMRPAAAKIFPPNLLSPLFNETYPVPSAPSILEQLSRLWYYSRNPEPPKHLSVAPAPRIRSALAIGVHGFFPAPLIRTLLGQPTGTSIKFADMAAKSIQHWTKSHGYECQVKTAALEGEGKIAERIELLWKLLLNWIEEIRKSDFVMIACHSQGVPVAIMLVAKLLQFGCVNTARVGICAMAGVSMGPFPEFKSRWISGTAGELFEFSDPSSKVSTDYIAALETVLKFGVRISFIGSIDDQLVSLESSLFTPVSHPHIYRAVLIDSRVHAPNFLSHLVGFALKLRNLGVPDHGLIRELSSPLAGSLYTGEGHSRIYEDDAVYDLAVAFALETSSIPNTALSQRPSMGPNVANPYILPFAMRGILEEDFVKTEMQAEAMELLQQFDDWRPTTKVLKDVKFRLEGIRSKL